ncbi:adenosine kinase [Methylovirgula sp. 4M-Z18]|uniref:adenosine kinase n=1 Tax=Methylovirgula sp. 4M-Z18 TaxID=2293567 RepID=UPI00403F51AC
MMTQSYDVLGIGNAIMDVIARADDAFLVRERIPKGAMNLIDEERAEHLYGAMGQATIISGGSAANTIVGVQSLGARAAYIGKVKADDVGDLFAHDLRSTGVHFATLQPKDGPATARSFIFVTEDGERTMNTYLGASQNLSVADIDSRLVESSAIVYLEGYLWDPPAAKDAFVKASHIAHKAGRRVALTLSDSFCVDRYRAEFLDLMRKGIVDIVFANESEVKSLYETSDFETAVSALRDENVLGIVTRSELGSMVVEGQATHVVPAFPIDKLVDTTGAGDLFAGGFLYGLAKGADYVTCANLGGLAAAEIIQHLGARPQLDLAQHAKMHGLG